MAVKYVIIPEKRTILAILENTEWDAHNKIKKMIGENSPFRVWSDSYRMPDKFKAAAVCHPDDEWDVAKGMEIAKDRVLEKWSHSVAKRCAKFISHLEKLNSNIFGENTP